MSEDYFAYDRSAAPAGQGRYLHRERDVPSIEVTPGLTFRPIVGQGVMVNFVHFEPHTAAPIHAHQEEQITCVLEGEFEFELGGEKRMVRAGDVVVVPPHVPHGARTLDSECFEIDVFSPPRKGVLRLIEEQAQQD